MSPAQESHQPSDPPRIPVEEMETEVRLTPRARDLNPVDEWIKIKSGKPPPNKVEDPFLQLLKSQRKMESARCDAWKEEVNNLLIFVSLVSISRLVFEVLIVRRLVSSRPLSPRSLSSRTRVSSRTQAN